MDDQSDYFRKFCMKKTYLNPDHAQDALKVRVELVDRITSMKVLDYIIFFLTPQRN